MTTPVWRKSSRSNAQGGDCVEVAALPEGIGIRDSKNPDGPTLCLPGSEFTGLIRRVKAGSEDLV